MNSTATAASSLQTHRAPRERVFARRTDRGIEQCVPGVWTSEEFGFEIKREMMRSDRTGQPLTLLLLGVLGANGRNRSHESALKLLASTVAANARQTDVVGWFRDAESLRVGLILFDTRSERADYVMNNLRRAFSAEFPLASSDTARPELSCEMFGYPADGEAASEGIEQPSFFSDEDLAGLLASGARDAFDLGESSRSAPASEAPVEALIPCALPRWKRSMDVLLSTAGLAVISPLLALIAAAIKLTSRGPVIYKQQRVGCLGKSFELWKFRSMRVNNDPGAHEHYLKSLITHSANGTGDDESQMIKLDTVNPEITFLGRILRATCLDELPQLVNVLRGEMSLVGPRPCLPYEASHYLRWHHRRFDTMPGITGLWQVKGKNSTTFKQMIRLDIHYARNRSAWLDIKILALTAPAVAREIQQAITPPKMSPERNQSQQIEV